MKSRKTLIGAGMGLVAVASAAAIAVASAPTTPVVHPNNGSAALQQVVTPTRADVAAAFSTFAVRDTTPADVAIQQKLRDSFGAGSASDGNPAGNADFAAAHPSPITGSSDRVWLAPAGNQVCVFIPDPVDGYGSTCATLSEIQSGHAFAVMTGPPGQDNATVTVAVLTPNGAAAPQVREASGHSTSLRVTANVAAAKLPTTDTLETAAGPISLSQFHKAGKGVAIHD